MASLFSKYDRKAQRKLEHSEKPRKPTFAGKLKMRISATTKVKGIG
jgi:hypothetical protein